MAARIDTVEGRSKLKPRPSTYWHKLGTGRHVGFRKLSAESDGAWLAQAYDPATKKQTRRSLGTLDDRPAHQRFDAAKKLAEEWFTHLDRGGNLKTITVATACARYIARLREAQEEKKAAEIEARFKRWVYADKIAGIELTKLTRRHVEDWRSRLAKTPVVVNPHAKQEHIRTRTRAPSSLNRDMTALKAALNKAHDDGAVTADTAWRVALRPVENADGRRDAYLDRKQRSALIAEAGGNVGQFLRALSLVPLRPGALASLTVANFDKRLGVLTVGKDKAGRDRRIKLPPNTASFFETHAQGKLPGAPLLAREDGSPWNKDAWKKPVKAAAQACGLPDSVTAYALRHSVITDLVTGGLDMMTVAMLSGTSVAMIEKHYGYLRADHAAAALAGLAL
jgi:site-specific recombinase XerD